MRFFEVGLAIAGLALGIASPLFREMIEPRTGCLPPAAVQPTPRKSFEKGALFAAIPRIYHDRHSITLEQILVMIDEGCDVHGEPGEPPLVVALGEGGTVKIIEGILGKGADIDALGVAFYECSMRKDSTALMVAADRGMLKETRLLLDHGAAVDRRSAKGETALMAAVGAFYEHETGPEIVQLLLVNGADPMARDNFGNNLLHIAASGVHWGPEDLAYVRLLLSKGVDVNARNEAGETPLHCVADCASYDGYAVDIARLLLEQGADPLLEDGKGRTSVDVAKVDSPQEMVKLLSSWTGRRK